MIRQVYIFYNKERIYNYSYAIGLSDDDLNNVKQIIASYFDMPIYEKIFQHPISERFQIFHKSANQCLFLIVTDLTDQMEYIKEIINRISNIFNKTFENPNDVNIEINKRDIFNDYIKDLQYDLHSKITIVGPTNSGKTTLYNILRGGNEKEIMNFAKSSVFTIDKLKFDLWDFQLNDNFSLLWSKFLSGSDLIIFLFDLSNYHLKVINHFLTIIKQDAKLAKLLIIGNKNDLIEDIDIKLIKNELNISDFEQISLLSSDAKEKAVFLISKILALRELLPPSFKTLIKDAVSTENEGKLVLAIAKYKELIKICNQYQDFTYIDTFKQKVEELQAILDKQVERRRAEESKKRFEIPEKIMFTKKVEVRPLPSNIEEIQIAQAGIPPAPKMSMPKKKVSKIAEGLTLFNKEEKITQDKKENAPSIEIKNDFKVIAPFDQKPRLEEAHEISNFPRTLQNLIEQKGSSLSLKLCEQLVRELRNTLARTLTLEDIQMAADVFVKQESSII